jgi:hypothetical protein
MSKEFMDHVNAAVRGNGVFEEYGLSSTAVRQCTPHPNLVIVKGSFMNFMGIFYEPYACILRVHITW